MIKSPLRYPGGKQREAAHIASLFPKDFTAYCEPFCGGASVALMAKAKDLGFHWWINDLDASVAMFWQTVQNKAACEYLMSTLQEVLDKGLARSILECTSTEAPFDYDNRPYSEFAAFKFFLRNRCSFSGSTYKGGLSKSFGRFTKSAIERLRPMPAALEGVSITRWDALKCIKFEAINKHNDPYVFLYLDPPYCEVKTDKIYKHHEFDHELMAFELKRTQKRFLLSLDDCPTAHKLYSWASITSWSKSYGMTNAGGNATKRGAELFISNYEVKI